MIKVCLHIIFLLFTQFTFAQLQLGRSVIGSTGSDTTTASFKVTSTVGETSVSREESNLFWLTQGFQQPLQIEGLIAFSLNIQNASCIGRSNGFEEVQTITEAGIELLGNDSKRNINFLTIMVKAISNSGNTNMNGPSKELDFVVLAGHNLWIQDILTIHLIS